MTTAKSIASKCKSANKVAAATATATKFVQRQVSRLQRQRGAKAKDTPTKPNVAKAVMPKGMLVAVNGTLAFKMVVAEEGPNDVNNNNNNIKDDVATAKAVEDKATAMSTPSYSSTEESCSAASSPASGNNTDDGDDDDDDANIPAAFNLNEEAWMQDGGDDDGYDHHHHCNKRTNATAFEVARHPALDMWRVSAWEDEDLERIENGLPPIHQDKIAKARAAQSALDSHQDARAGFDVRSCANQEPPAFLDEVHASVVAAAHKAEREARAKAIADLENRRAAVNTSVTANHNDDDDEEEIQDDDNSLLACLRRRRATLRHVEVKVATAAVSTSNNNNNNNCSAPQANPTRTALLSEIRGARTALRPALAPKAALERRPGHAAGDQALACLLARNVPCMGSWVPTSNADVEDSEWDAPKSTPTPKPTPPPARDAVVVVEVVVPVVATKVEVMECVSGETRATAVVESGFAHRNDNDEGMALLRARLGGIRKAVAGHDDDDDHDDDSGDSDSDWM